MRRLEFDTHGRDWPHRDRSEFVRADGLTWHVQRMGSGSLVLLVHGTAASTHSWRALLPALAARHSVMAMDLPGHGFTSPPRSERGYSLPAMATSLTQLLDTLGVRPLVCVGHSAGAAILARMCLDGSIGPRAVVSLNGALLPLRGPVQQLFAPLAKLLTLNPFAPRLFAWWGTSRAAVERTIAGTGSTLDEAGIDLYARLFANPGHVSAALSMMASWDLEPLQPRLRELGARLLLVAGSNDRAIPPENAMDLAEAIPGAKLHLLRGLGHLAHEERPDLVAELIQQITTKPLPKAS